MIYVLATTAIFLMLLAAYISVMNWWCFIVSELNMRRGIDKHHSTVPLVSLILTGILAYKLYAFTPKGWIWIIPALDIGNWMLLIGLPWVIVQGGFKKEQKNK